MSCKPDRALPTSSRYWYLNISDCLSGLFPSGPPSIAFLSLSASSTIFISSKSSVIPSITTMASNISQSTVTLHGPPHASDAVDPLPELSACEYHPRKRLKLFCKIHQNAVCGTCIQTSNLGCQRKYLDQVALGKEDGDQRLVRRRSYDRLFALLTPPDLPSCAIVLPPPRHDTTTPPRSSTITWPMFSHPFFYLCQSLPCYVCN